MMARSGLTTLKYSTASTFIETLSREITSWVGTSITCVRRSTRTICCRNGASSTRPGPLTWLKRPSVKTTARSYSRRILMLAAARITATHSRARPQVERSMMWPTLGAVS